MKELAVNLIATLAFPIMLAAGAATADAPPEGHPHRRPPPEAFEACKDKKVEDACSVTFREHTITGKCAATPEGTLVCRPERPPRPPEQK
jgi:hypothetical protein